MPTSTHPVRTAITSIAFVAAFALAGCGAAGSRSSFAPPPPPPVIGFDVMADAEYAPLSTQSVIDPDDRHHLTITVDRDAGTYTLTTDDPAILLSTVSYAMKSVNDFITSARADEVMPDGTRIETSLFLYKDSPERLLRHTLLAQWNYRSLSPGGGEEDWVEQTYYLVIGNPTLASAMPVTGTATYSGGNFAQDCDCWSSATLTADFGTGVLDASIEVPWDQFVGGAAAFHLRGSGAISGASFAFPLTGTADIYSGDALLRTEGASGALAGAFYGPAAEEAGAVFTAASPSLPYVYQGAFAIAR